MKMLVILMTIITSVLNFFLSAQSLVKADKPLRELLLNPLLPKDLKKDAISSVLTKKKASPLTINLFSEFC